MVFEFYQKSSISHVAEKLPHPCLEPFAASKLDRRVPRNTTFLHWTLQFLLPYPLFQILLFKLCSTIAVVEPEAKWCVWSCCRPATQVDRWKWECWTPQPHRIGLPTPFWSSLGIFWISDFTEFWGWSQKGGGLSHLGQNYMYMHHSWSGVLGRC